jgi:hypothetical protein
VTVLLLKVDVVKILQGIKQRLSRREEKEQNVQPSAN